MSGKRATVAEGLLTFITRMWPFSSMDASMDGKRRSLNELLSAFVTLIWPIRNQKTPSHNAP